MSDFGLKWGKDFRRRAAQPRQIFLEVPNPPPPTARDCVNSVRTAKDCDVTAHAKPTFAWADLATERERQLTTGKRWERTKRDFRCQFVALLFDLRAPSSTDAPVLLLNEPMDNRKTG